MFPNWNSEFKIRNSQFGIQKFGIQNSEFKIRNSKFAIRNLLFFVPLVPCSPCSHVPLFPCSQKSLVPMFPCSLSQNPTSEPLVYICYVYRLRNEEANTFCTFYNNLLHGCGAVHHESIG
jgi:hypothetical protein